MRIAQHDPAIRTNSSRRTPLTEGCQANQTRARVELQRLKAGTQRTQRTRRSQRSPVWRSSASRTAGRNEWGYGSNGSLLVRARAPRGHEPRRPFLWDCRSGRCRYHPERRCQQKNPGALGAESPWRGGRSVRSASSVESVSQGVMANVGATPSSTTRSSAAPSASSASSSSRSNQPAQHPLDLGDTRVDLDRAVRARRRWIGFFVIRDDRARVFEHVSRQHGHDAIGRCYHA